MTTANKETIRCIRRVWLRPDKWNGIYAKVEASDRVEITTVPIQHGKYRGTYKLMDLSGHTIAHISEGEVKFLAGKSVPEIIERQRRRNERKEKKRSSL